MALKAIFTTVELSAFQRALLAWSFAVVMALALPLSGIGGDFERQFQNMRASLLAKPATGQLAIVEIDAKSIQALEQWPWPRQHYAQLVDRLSASGVTQIAFDVDFSSVSSPEQDQMFADSIADSQAVVVLPTFKQKASSTNQDYAESLPIALLRENAFLASVNVHPDENGQLNNYSYGTVTGGMARPSLASMLAESSGTVEGSFMIDQSIDPMSIPRYSFADILQDDFPLEQLRGKKVVIGATAIELGDRYPISRFGVMPGVVIQAMAAETLLQKMNMRNLGYFPPLAIAAGISLAVVMRRRKLGGHLIAVLWGTGLSLFALLLVTEYVGLVTFSNLPAYLFCVTFLAVSKIFRMNRALNASRYLNSASQLPNEAAMQKYLADQSAPDIATARLVDFRELLVMTDDQTRLELFARISERLAFLSHDKRIFHLDSDIIAWVIDKEYANDISAHFATAAALFQAPVIASKKPFKLQVAFGVSNESINKAKMAADHAIARGKRWSWLDDEATQAIDQKQHLLIDLDVALDNGDIWVVYQPKWNIAANCLDGAEALVRWQHPERGMIGPDIFIPILEKANRIDELTLHVLEQSLHDFARWSQQGTDLSCSVNISAQLLHDEKFISQAIDAVTKTVFPNQRIIFEVTETAALADLDLSIQALERIRDAGIKVSIDDYGTGQSTMSYLQRLPIDEIKIDQSFVRNMTTDRSNELMVKSTIELAHGLDLKIVAEGIEDKPCLHRLQTLGCDVGQGWHISKPISAREFEENWVAQPITETDRQAKSA